MSSFELPNTPELAAEGRDSTRYVTNGRSLLEIAATTENYGLAGGTFTTLVDSMSGKTVAVDVDALSMLTLQEVTPGE